MLLVLLQKIHHFILSNIQNILYPKMLLLLLLLFFFLFRRQRKRRSNWRIWKSHCLQAGHDSIRTPWRGRNWERILWFRKLNWEIEKLTVLQFFRFNLMWFFLKKWQWRRILDRPHSISAKDSEVLVSPLLTPCSSVLYSKNIKICMWHI